MKKAAVILDRDYTIAPIDPRLFGSFIEHLGRAVYGGIYEPSHPTATPEGFRQDVMGLIRKLRIPVIRYPGGNFVSGFRWEDSIGPKESRPRRLDLAWDTTETNEVGLHEFVSFCRQVDSEVMYAVNLGTRGPENAKDIVEYCNHPSGTKWSDLRIQNGAAEPFNIRLWCLGNEMDGPWQMGQKTAYEYGRAANEAAKLMKWVDPSIELVACGSSSSMMPTFGDWELTMLNECYDNVDYVSLHRYYGKTNMDTPTFLASTMDLEDFIRTVASICDAVKGKKHSKKKLNLSFDEWNVWYHSHGQDAELRKEKKWGQALPLLQDIYTLEDALLAGSMLLTFLRNADRVKIACLAQLVNVIAPIMTRNGGPSWCQTIFYPFLHVSNYGRGTALNVLVDTPVYDCREYEKVPVVDAAATVDSTGNVTVFCVNRDLQEDCVLKLDLRSFSSLSKLEHICLTHSDPLAVNTEENPDNVVPHSEKPLFSEDGTFEVRLSPLSWNVLRITD